MALTPKRRLTPSEITEILGLFTPNPSIPDETAIAVSDNIKRLISRQLKSVEIYPKNIPALIKRIERDYHTSKIEGGDMCGVSSASSLSEPSMQLTLNTFHFTGISSFREATLGLPWLEKLINARAVPLSDSSMTVYFKRTSGGEDDRGSASGDLTDMYSHVLKSLEYKLLADFCVSIYLFKEGELTDHEKLFGVRKLAFTSEEVSWYKFYGGLVDCSGLYQVKFVDSLTNENKKNQLACHTVLGRSDNEVMSNNNFNRDQGEFDDEKNEGRQYPEDVIFSSKFPYHFRLVLNVQLLIKYDLTLREVARRVEQTYPDVWTIPLPDCTGTVDVYSDTSKLQSPKDIVLAIKKRGDSQGSSASSASVNLENTFDLFGEHGLNETNKDYYAMQHVLKPMILNIELCGIENVSKCYFRKIPVLPPSPTKEVPVKEVPTKKEEWIVETKGSNLTQLAELDEVDFTRSTSNNLWEIYNFFGIEAARTFLIQELSKVLSGTSVCHIELLADCMTSRTGRITPANRYGSDISQSGPLAVASFETSFPVLVNSAFKGLTDRLAVSSQIILGQTIKGGTGMGELLLDMDRAVAGKITGPSRLPIFKAEEVVEITV